MRRSGPGRSTGRRQQARGVVTRARLLRVARELFARHGYATTSRADIANRAGVGMSTVYHHFPDKREMLLELIEQWGDDLPVQRQTALDIERANAGDARGAARKFLRDSYEHLRKGPSFLRAIQVEAERDRVVRRAYSRAQKNIIDWMAQRNEAGLRDGLIRPERDATAAAFVMHHVVETLISELASGHLTNEFTERVLQELEDLILLYMFRDGGGERPSD